MMKTAKQKFNGDGGPIEKVEAKGGIFEVGQRADLVMPIKMSYLNKKLEQKEIDLYAANRVCRWMFV